jgi:hypothetical protein
MGRRLEPVLTIVKAGKLTFLYPHGARERRGVGWLTLCNI